MSVFYIVILNNINYFIASFTYFLNVYIKAGKIALNICTSHSFTLYNFYLGYQLLLGQNFFLENVTGSHHTYFEIFIC